MAHYLPPRKEMPKLTFNHLQSNQGALPTITRGQSSAPTAPKVCDPLCATANRPDAPRTDCLPNPKVDVNSCAQIYQLHPYFIPRAGHPNRKPMETLPDGKRKKHRDRMFDFSESKVFHDRAFGEWERRFGCDFFYTGERRL
ncbi:hypothetical protein EGW08_001223 [Elysia chlorotica]|uniref:Uncharacterized protein n=1 Tax=Elysia chlorotica TaxID=188477 RepID=A0A433UB31_ELYCH|nr:hypothetical protein EGW08_001223 [Elysia chlorotica]